VLREPTASYPKLSVTHEKEHKNTKIKLIWPFTSNDRRKNGKKVYKWKPMLRRPLGRPKNRWKDDIRNDIKN
jgi:hypothetical protein